MKNKILLSTAVLVVFAVGMVLNMPSIQLFRWISLPANAEIRGLSGSVSSGRIAWLQVDNFQLQGIEYRFQPSCLPMLSICYKVFSDQGQLEASIKVNAFSQILTVTDARFYADASFLSDMPGLFLKPAGDFTLDLVELTIKDGKVGVAVGSLGWEQAGIEGDATVFGNYQAGFDLNETGVLLVSSGENNSLIVEGEITLERMGQYDFDLSFRSSPKLPGSVKSLLEASLEQTDLDKYKLRKKGQISHPLLKFL